MSTVDIIFALKFKGVIYVAVKKGKVQMAFGMGFTVRATFCYNYCGCDGGAEKLREGAEWGEVGKSGTVEAV
jgi:hypothetical protein